MRFQLVFALGVGALGALAFACSSSTSSDPYANESDFCTAYAKAVCQVSSSCQFDSAGCIAYQTGQCQQLGTSAKASGARKYSSGNVQSCIDALNGAYGNNATAVSAATLKDVNAKCQRVYVGGAAEGAACSSDYDCKVSGTVCASTPGSSPVCAKPTPRDDGAACADPGDQCPAADYCAPQTGTSKCVPAAAHGAACSTSVPCVGTDHCVNGVCASLAKQGEPCAANADCQTGLFCDTFTSASAPTPVCVTQLGFARGSVDCLGVEGQASGGSTHDAGGGGTDSGASNDASTEASTDASTD